MTASLLPAFDVHALRAREYPWMTTDDTVYLNAASTGPMPHSAVDAANHWTALRAQPHRIPLSLMFDTVATSRAQFARLVGARPAHAPGGHSHLRR